MGKNNIALVYIDSIQENQQNPRYISNEQFEKLKRSIQDFPEMLELRPIVVNSENIVLGGNMRLRALRELGYEKVPVVYANKIDSEKQAEFIIKDNVGLGSWDWDVLANEWDEEKLIDWGLDFDFDIEKHAEDDKYKEPEEIETNIVNGDLIEIGEHKLLCGDSTDSDCVSKLMKGVKADVVFTDPPYDFEDYSWTDNMLMFSNGHQFILNSEQRNVDISAKHRELLSRWYAIDFRKAHMISNKQAMTRVDFVAEFRNSENVKFYNREKGFRTLIESVKHSSNKDGFKQMKNPQLPALFIEHHTNENEICLDLFLGSGTTMLACEQIDRICYGIEIDPKNCQTVIDRMLSFSPNIQVKVNGEKYAS